MLGRHNNEINSERASRLPAHLTSPLDLTRQTPTKHNGSLVNDASLEFRLQAKLLVYNPPAAMSSPRNLSSLQKKVWNGSIPLEIRLSSSECRTFDHSDPYLVFP